MLVTRDDLVVKLQIFQTFNGLLQLTVADISYVLKNLQIVMSKTY